MARTSVMEILGEAQDLLVRTFNRNELRQLLFSKMDINLDEIAPNAKGTKDLVFEMLTWMDRRGQLFELIRVAAAARTKIPEWQSIIARTLQSPANPAQNSPNIDASGLRGNSIPDEIIALVRGYSRLRRVLPDGDQRTVQLQAIVNQLLGMELENYDLSERYHLGADEGDRLLAILSLIRRPDAQYLHWLAERVFVESRFVGYQSTVALVSAANTLPVVDLDDVTSAIDLAREWIPHNERDGGRWKKLDQAINVIMNRSAG